MIQRFQQTILENERGSFFLVLASSNSSMSNSTQEASVSLGVKSPLFFSSGMRFDVKVFFGTRSGIHLSVNDCDAVPSAYLILLYLRSGDSVFAIGPTVHAFELSISLDQISLLLPIISFG